VRKNDERYPRHERDSDDKGTQNKGQNEAKKERWLVVLVALSAPLADTMCKFCELCLYKIYDVGEKVDVLVNFFGSAATRNSGTGVSSKSEITLHQSCKDTGAVICVHQSEANRRGSCQNIVMNTLDKAKALCSAILMQQGYKPKMLNEQEAPSFSSELLENDEEKLAENILLCNTEPTNKVLENELSDEEEELRLQMVIDSIMSQVGEDGFTVEDRAILRGNLPIPEEYGSYKLSPAELQKVTPVKYVPDQDVYIVDEERLEAPEDRNS